MWQRKNAHMWRYYTHQSQTQDPAESDLIFELWHGVVEQIFSFKVSYFLIKY